MFQPENILSSSTEQVNILLLIGMAVFLGTVGGKVFQKLRIPQIVGYVFVGVLLGPILGIVSVKEVEMLEPFNLFALGVIGFLIGGELKKEIFTKYGKHVTSILLFEGLTAFTLVGVLTFLIMIYFSGWHTALAVAVVFAAICAATDPASTVNVLWEYKTRGPLTTMLTAIVALDDALALVLYAIGVSIAGIITGHQQTGFTLSMLRAFWEIGGSLGVGISAGFALTWILNRIEQREKVLVFTLSFAILVIGLVITLHLDVIITSMALGVVLVNTKSRKAALSFELIHNFAPPIYVLFFVLVGARLNVTNLSPEIGILVAGYVVGSIVGKTAGSYWGGVYSHAVPTVKKYLGFCLYPQGGIAVGLLIMASHRFEPETSSIMLLVVIIGALILQIIGPIGVKYGAKKAGEVGLNITEEDLIHQYDVKDIMKTDIPLIKTGTSLKEVIQIVSSTDNFYYCVVDNDNKLLGVITLDGIRNTFATEELNEWLVALDIMEPIITETTPQTSLADALEKANRFETEFLPVVTSGENRKLEGLLDVNAVHRKLSTETLSKQREADRMATLN